MSINNCHPTLQPSINSYLPEVAVFFLLKQGAKGTCYYRKLTPDKSRVLETGNGVVNALKPSGKWFNEASFFANFISNLNSENTVDIVPVEIDESGSITKVFGLYSQYQRSWSTNGRFF